MPISASAIYHPSELSSFASAEGRVEHAESNASYRSAGPGIAGDRKAGEHSVRALDREDKSMAALVDKSVPLQLLDLPLDILSLIVEEVIFRSPAPSEPCANMGNGRSLTPTI